MWSSIFFAGSEHLPLFEGRHSRIAFDAMMGLPPLPESLGVGTGKHKRSPSGDRDRRKVRRTEDEIRRHRGERDRRVGPCPSRHGTEGRRRDRPAEVSRGLEERRENVRVTGDASHLQPWARDSRSGTTSERYRHVRGHSNGRRDKYVGADGGDRNGKEGHGESSKRREDVRWTADASHLLHRARDSKNSTTSERYRHAHDHADGRRDKDDRGDGSERHERGGHRGSSERREDVKTSGRGSHLEPRARDTGLTLERSRHARGHADERRVKDGRGDDSERHGGRGHGGGHPRSPTQAGGPQKRPLKDQYNNLNTERGRGSSWWVGGDIRRDLLPLVPRFGEVPRLAGAVRGESGTGQKGNPIELDEDGADFLPEMTPERRLGWNFGNGGGDNAGTSTSISGCPGGPCLTDGDSVGGSTDLYRMWYGTCLDQSSSCRDGIGSGDELGVHRRDDCDAGDVKWIGEVGVSEQIRRRQRSSVVIDLVDA